MPSYRKTKGNISWPQRYKLIYKKPAIFPVKYPYGLINYHKTTQNIEKYKQQNRNLYTAPHEYQPKCRNV